MLKSVKLLYYQKFYIHLLNNRNLHMVKMIIKLLYIIPYMIFIYVLNHQINKNIYHIFIHNCLHKINYNNYLLYRYLNYNIIS